jgi:AmmeMemoRadiSam system protein B
MPISTAVIVPHPPLLVPEVGRGQEYVIMDTLNSYRKAMQAIAQDKPKTIILISPHAPAYSDYINISSAPKISENLFAFGGKEVVEAPVDQPLVKAITEICEKEHISAGPNGEESSGRDHGTFVPLYYLNQYYTGYEVIICSLSALDRKKQYRFGQCIERAVTESGKKVTVIASGDLSHRLKEDGPYGFAKEGPELDQQLTDIMKSGNLQGFMDIEERLCRKGAECGLGSFITLAGIVGDKSVESEFLSYEGSFGVGYACCVFRF